VGHTPPATLQEGVQLRFPPQEYKWVGLVEVRSYKWVGFNSSTVQGFAQSSSTVLSSRKALYR